MAYTVELDWDCFLITQEITSLFKIFLLVILLMPSCEDCRRLFCCVGEAAAAFHRNDLCVAGPHPSWAVVLPPQKPSGLMLFLKPAASCVHAVIASFLCLLGLRCRLVLLSVLVSSDPPADFVTYWLLEYLI